jgi:biotin carboxyl carrier protein
MASLHAAMAKLLEEIAVESAAFVAETRADGTPKRERTKRAVPPKVVAPPPGTVISDLDRARAARALAQAGYRIKSGHR